MMYTYYCLLILFYLCNGICGADIHLYIYKNKTGKLYEESQTIKYLEDEAVQLTCSITGNTVKNGIYPTLTWIEGGREWAPPNDGVSMSTTKILKDDDDGTELKCRAKSKILDKEWTISAYFEKKKSPQELLKAKSNLFKFLLIGIGGVIGATILLLSIYRLFLCCRNRRAPDLSLVNEKVLYSEVDKKPNKESDKLELTEIGFDNIVCQLKDNETYVSFDSIEDQHFDSSDKTLKIQDDSREIKVPDEKNVHDDVKVSVRNTEEDSDC